MFKKIFTSKQLSLFFQIAVLINITSFFLDLIVYHYFSKNEFLKLLTENLDHLSIFMICLTIISQALLIFAQRHELFIKNYKLLAVTTEACIAIFLVWFITIEDGIHSKIIIFMSSLSQSNHNYRIILTLTAICIMLCRDFYRTIKNPEKITDTTILQMLHSICTIVIRNHIFLLIFIFAITKFKMIKKFAQAFLHHSKSSLFFDLSLLEFILPIAWLAAILYAFYQLQKAHKNIP